MATKIEIVNLALTMFGHRRLASLSAENDTARAVNAVYTPTLLEVLEARDWTFARKQEALALIAEVDSDGVQPVQGYDYLYAMPNQCVKVRRVFLDGQAHSTVQDQSQKQNFEEVEDPTSHVTAIATDVEDAYCYFTSKVEDVARFNPAFVKCLAAALASELCLPLTQDRNLAAGMMSLYQQRLSEASRISAGRENPKNPRTSGYIDFR